MQAFQLLTATMDRFTGLTSVLSDTLTTLASNWLGATTPSAPQEGMFWSDSGTGYLQHYRNAQFHVLGEDTRQLLSFNNATAATDVLPFASTVDIVSVIVFPEGTTTGSSSEANYTVDLQTAGGTSLFSTPPSTETEEFADGEVWEQNVDQNATVTAGVALRLIVTQNGAPTSVQGIVGIKYRPRYS